MSLSLGSLSESDSEFDWESHEHEYHDDDETPSIFINNKWFRWLKDLGSGAYGKVSLYEHVTARDNIRLAVKTGDIENDIRGYKFIWKAGCQKFFTNYYPDEDDEDFVAMRLMNMNLTQWKRKYREWAFYYDECWKIIFFVVRALQCLNVKKLLYNDLKLDNVLVNIKRNRITSVKLGDVGCVSKFGKRGSCYSPGYSNRFSEGDTGSEMTTLLSFVFNLLTREGDDDYETYKGMDVNLKDYMPSKSERDWKWWFSYLLVLIHSKADYNVLLHYMKWRDVYSRTTLDKSYLLKKMGDIFMRIGHHDQGKTFYTLAAKKGSVAAQLIMGKLMVKENPLKAAEYFKLAASNGSAEAKNKLEALTQIFKKTKFV